MFPPSQWPFIGLFLEDDVYIDGAEGPLIVTKRSFCDLVYRPNFPEDRKQVFGNLRLSALFGQIRFNPRFQSSFPMIYCFNFKYLSIEIVINIERRTKVRVAQDIQPNSNWMEFFSLFLACYASDKPTFWSDSDQNQDSSTLRRFKAQCDKFRRQLGGKWDWIWRKLLLQQISLQCDCENVKV